MRQSIVTTFVEGKYSARAHAGQLADGGTTNQALCRYVSAAHCRGGTPLVTSLGLAIQFVDALAPSSVVVGPRWRCADGLCVGQAVKLVPFHFLQLWEEVRVELVDALELLALQDVVMLQGLFG